MISLSWLPAQLGREVEVPSSPSRSAVPSRHALFITALYLFCFANLFYG